MDLREEKTEMPKPITDGFGETPTSRHGVTSTTASPNYPQVVCPPYYKPVTTESVMSVASLWAQTNTYVSCVSLVNPTSNDTVETRWTRAPCSLRTESYSGNDKVSDLTFCDSMTAAHTPSPATAMTTGASSSTVPAVVQTTAPTSIASPGLHWQPPNSHKTVAIAVTVPLVSIAFLCVAIYFFFYRRKKNNAKDKQPSTAYARPTGTGPINTGPCGNRSSGPLVVPNAIGKPGSDFPVAPTRASLLGGVGVQNPEDNKPRWTNRGYREYGDGKRRPPPPLSPKALNRISGTSTSPAERGSGAWPHAAPGCF